MIGWIILGSCIGLIAVYVAAARILEKVAEKVFAEELNDWDDE